MDSSNLKMQDNTNIILISVALTSLAAFAIFIPLVIIPSIRDMSVTYDFDPDPVLCVTVGSVLEDNPEKCDQWSFCKQGCEKVPTTCYQVLINYRKHNNTASLPDDLPESEWQNDSLWDRTFTKLLVNAKGCGEAPDVRCNEFGEIISPIGKAFGCHYSRRDPGLVVIDPSWEIPSSSLLVTLGLPATLLTTSLFIFALLAANYCPCMPDADRMKPEVAAVPQGRYSSIQDLHRRS